MPREDVTEYYDLEYECTYRGLDCVASREDDSERIEVLYMGDSYAAARAGMKEVDQAVWQAWVNRSELADLREVRKERLAH